MLYHFLCEHLYIYLHMLLVGEVFENQLLLLENNQD